MIYALLLIASFCKAATTGVPGVQLQDEGTIQAQVGKLNCVGSGIACTTSGGVGTLTVSGGGAGSASLTTISSGSFTSGTEIYIATVAPNIFYRLTISRVQNTSAGRLCMKFNGDVASNYRYSTTFMTDNGAGQGQTVSSSDICLALDPQAVEAGLGSLYQISFRTVEGTGKVNAAWYGQIEENSRRSSTYGGGFWTGTTLSSATFRTTAGTMTGNWVLEATP
jgi:hypothetical protein